MGCLPHVKAAVAAARAACVPVFWVVRQHAADGSDAEVFRRHLFANGKGYCVAGTRGCDLVEGLECVDGDTRVVKTRFSAFTKTHLEQLLHERGITHLVVAGVQTPNCIRATAFDGLALDFSVTVLSDATASATGFVQDANLYDLRYAGCQVMATSDWAAGLAAPAGPSQ
jgi:nicotinamidase-related amidase